MYNLKASESILYKVNLPFITNKIHEAIIEVYEKHKIQKQHNERGGEGFSCAAAITSCCSGAEAGGFTEAGDSSGPSMNSR